MINFGVLLSMKSLYRDFLLRISSTGDYKMEIMVHKLTIPFIRGKISHNMIGSLKLWYVPDELSLTISSHLVTVCKGRFSREHFNMNKRRRHLFNVIVEAFS